MPKLTPEELLAIKSGADLADKMPYVRDDIEKMMHQVEIKAFTQIAEGKLSPDRAFSLFLELYAYHRLLKKLEQRVTVGKSVAKTHLQELTGDN